MTIVRSRHAGPGNVRPFVPNRPPLVVAEPAVNRLEELEQEKLALEEALAHARKVAVQDVAAAREEGRAEGAEAAQQDFAQLAAALAQTAEAAAADFRAILPELERLSIVIAHTALAKLLDPPQQATDLVTAAIARQVAELRQRGLLTVEVSSADFPDEESLATAKCASGGAAVAVAQDLAAGGCRIKLRYGEIDIGIPTQWQALSRLLLDAAGSDPQP